MSQSLSHRKIILFSSLGAGFEFFDFTIFALFASYISANFFPQDNQVLALINTFAIFALGYLARPLGGIILGHIGDRYGRKYAFSYAILIMAIATLLMGCLPGYATLGISAPLFLIALRLIQGLSVGGEVPGATVFIMEYFAHQRPAFMVSFIFMSMTLSNALASLIGYTLNYFFDHEQMLSWGWRIPFILGSIGGLFAYILRRRCLETPIFLQLLKEQRICKVPFFELWKQSPSLLLVGFCLSVFIATLVSLLLFLPAYLQTVLHLSAATAYFFSTVNFIVLGLLVPVFGYLADRVSHKTLIIAGSILTIIVGALCFQYVIVIPILPIWCLGIAIAVTGAITNGCYAIATAELFPPYIRYSGMAFCFNAAFALFGGTAPLVFTSMIEITGVSIAPYYYLVVCALITLLAALFLHGKKRKVQQGYAIGEIL